MLDLHVLRPLMRLLWSYGTLSGRCPFWSMLSFPLLLEFFAEGAAAQPNSTDSYDWGVASWDTLIPPSMWWYDRNSWGCGHDSWALYSRIPRHKRRVVSWMGGTCGPVSWTSFTRTWARQEASQQWCNHEVASWRVWSTPTRCDEATMNIHCWAWVLHMFGIILFLDGTRDTTTWIYISWLYNGDDAGNMN